MTANQLVESLSEAIAYAEGYYIEGSRPNRNNNPGDLTVDITGTGVGFDGPFVVYGSAYDGWQALRRQIEKMIDGTSSIYNRSMSILEIASRYTTTQVQSWANNVAGYLGVDTSVTLDSLLNDTTVTAVEISASVLVFVGAIVLFFLKKGR